MNYHSVTECFYTESKCTLIFNTWLIILLDEKQVQHKSCFMFGSLELIYSCSAFAFEIRSRETLLCEDTLILIHYVCNAHFHWL